MILNLLIRIFFRLGLRTGPTLFLVIFYLLPLAHASDGVETAIELDAIEVTALANSQTNGGAPPVFGQNVTKAQGIQSIDKFLESTPGIYAGSTGKGQRTVMVRGFLARQLDFRFDGLPLDTGYDGMTGLDLLPLNWIGWAQVRHADSGATDDVGFGGRIDFYSAMPSPFEASINIDRTTVIGAISHAYKHKTWSWFVSAGGHYSLGQIMSKQFKATPDEDGGLRDASDRQGYNAMVKIKRSVSDWGEVEASGAYSQAPRSVPTGIQTGSPRFWRYPAWHLALSNLQLNFATDLVYGLAQAWYIEQGNTLEIYDDAFRKSMLSQEASVSTWLDRDIGGQFELHSTQISLASQLQVNFQIKSEFRYQCHSSKNEVFFFEKEENEDSSRLIYEIRPGFDLQLSSKLRFFAAGKFVGNHELTHNDKFKPQIATAKAILNGGYSLGLDYAILENLKLSLRAARRLRMPTLKEQFMRIPQKAREDKILNAEIAYDHKIEIAYAPHPRVAFSITAYDTEIRELIALRYEQGLRQAYNIDKARLAGVDLSSKLGPFYKLSLELNYAYLYAYDLGKKESLSERPAHQVQASLRYAPIDALSLVLKARYESKRHSETWISAKHAWLGDIFLLDAEVTWQIEHFTVYLRGSNLLDMHYERSFAYPEAGWNLSIGAKISL